MEDQTVGVMPLSAVHKDADNVAAGSVCKVKWGSKCFSAEVIKISGKCIANWLASHSEFIASYRIDS